MKNPRTDPIYLAVIAAMQNAEEIGGPEGGDYRALMLAIEQEARERREAFEKQWFCASVSGQSKCAMRGKHEVHCDEFGGQWKDHTEDPNDRYFCFGAHRCACRCGTCTSVPFGVAHHSEFRLHCEHSKRAP